MARFSSVRGGLDRLQAMSRFETAQLTEAYRACCEDRVGVVQLPTATIIVVADGAGGIGNGAAAAEFVVSEVDRYARNEQDEFAWASLLSRIDHGIGQGESTAVIVELGRHFIRGASVGDSVAWIVNGDELLDLTCQQQRKPLLGSGVACPRGFQYEALSGTLLVATDGLANYVKREELTRTVATSDFYELPRKCLELVRLPSGELWDDVGIVVSRLRKQSRTRHRYVIE